MISINKVWRKVIYWRFLNKKPAQELLFDSDKFTTLLISISFNDSTFVEYQISLLKKYFKDSFIHIVVDNSTDIEIRNSIRNICFENQVAYAGVPNNPYSSNKSHGAAMHWAYFQIIRRFNFKRFGFLDHDIFPTADFTLEGKMNQGIYGRVMHSYYQGGYHSDYSPELPYWSLWAGFCFFDNDVLKGSFPWSFNFFSKHFGDGNFLDTGGGLWDKVYSKMDYPGELATYRKKSFSDKQGADIQNHSFEILDESWLHFVSLSNWRKIDDLELKKSLLLKILVSYK